MSNHQPPITPRLTIWALLLIAAALSGVYIYNTVYNSTIVSFAATPPPAIHPSDSAAPHHIRIADVGIDLDIEPGVINNGVWSVSEFHANHLKTSAHPGTTGNIIVYGHDAPEIFEKLHSVNLGDTITLTSENGTHTYAVNATYVTTPEDSSPVQQTDEEILTVYTCDGIFNEKRFIIHALPIR